MHLTHYMIIYTLLFEIKIDCKQGELEENAVHNFPNTTAQCVFVCVMLASPTGKVVKTL